MRTVLHESSTPSGPISGPRKTLHGSSSGSYPMLLTAESEGASSLVVRCLIDLLARQRIRVQDLAMYVDFCSRVCMCFAD